MDGMVCKGSPGRGGCRLVSGTTELSSVQYSVSVREASVWVTVVTWYVTPLYPPAAALQELFVPLYDTSSIVTFLYS